MSSPSEMIQHWLDHSYSYSQLNHGDPSKLVAMVKKRLAADQELMAAAKAKMATYVPALLKKDHISRVHKEFLEKVLKDE